MAYGTYGQTRAEIMGEGWEVPFYIKFGFGEASDPNPDRDHEEGKLLAYPRKRGYKWIYLGKKCGKCGLKFYVDPPPRECPKCACRKWNYKNHYKRGKAIWAEPYIIREENLKDILEEIGEDSKKLERFLEKIGTPPPKKKDRKRKRGSG